MPRLADVIWRSGLDLTWGYMKAGLYLAGWQGGMDGIYLVPSVHFFLQVQQINELARLGIIRNTYSRCKGYSFHVSTCI